MKISQYTRGVVYEITKAFEKAAIESEKSINILNHKLGKIDPTRALTKKGKEIRDMLKPRSEEHTSELQSH